MQYAETSRPSQIRNLLHEKDSRIETSSDRIRRKRIAYLISQYPAVNHTFILREILGLRALGMDIRVASIRAADRPLAEMSPDEQRETGATYYIRPRGWKGELASFFKLMFRSPLAGFKGLRFALSSSRWDLKSCARNARFFMEAVAVGEWMRKESLSHVHTHFASTVALFLSVMYPVEMSMTIHGPEEFDDPQAFLMREKASAAQAIVAISHYARSQVLRFCDPRDWGKCVVARLGVDPSLYTPDGSQPKEKPLGIICVGRLVPAKAQHVLLNACKLLRYRGFDFCLHLVGDGPDRGQLEQFAGALGIGGQVVFHGPLAHHRVLDLYRQAAIFALASFAEGVPVVLMEAMALEIPCVATAITGIPELIGNGREGLLAPPSDAAALADALAALLRDDDLRLRLGKAGRAKVLACYDSRKNLGTLADVLTSTSFLTNR